MVWSWSVRLEGRTEAWTKRDSLGAHAELFAQVQSDPGEARDQRRGETVASLLPGLTEAVREGRTRHFADITAEGDPADDEETVVEGGVMDVRVGRPGSQPEPEFSAPAIPNAAPRSARSETHAEPEAEVATSIASDMEIESRDRRVRLREESTDPPRHTLDASTDRESMVEPWTSRVQ